MFSSDAVAILKQFIQKFPVMFAYIKENPTEDLYYEKELFPGSDG